MRVIFLSVLLIFSSCNAKMKEKILEVESIRDIENVNSIDAANSSNYFFGQIYRELSKGDENIFFSPYSLATVLAMTSSGAHGKTLSEMQQVLGIKGTQIHFSYKKLNNDLMQVNNKKGVIFKSLTHLWGSSNYIFSPAFLNLLKSAYDSDLSTLNFKDDPKGARSTINKWAKKNTEGKINDLIPPKVITPLTRLVLTNAIYFKGNWQKLFDKKRTKKLYFNGLKGASILKEFMFKTEKVDYMEDDLMQMVSIPFKGKDVLFKIVLPKESKNFKKIEDMLSSKKLDEWSKFQRNDEVHISIPKMKLTRSFKLKEVLSTIGMPAAFTDYADFSKMYAPGEETLKIDEVVHKAYIEVNEEGAEAAAASAVMMGIKSMRRPIVFHADRPYIFMIIEKSTKTVLFVGRIIK